MHYSPRIWLKRGPETALLFPLPLLSSPPPLLPFLPFQPAARGPRGGLELAGIMARPTIGYLFTLLLTMISHSPSTP